MGMWYSTCCLTNLPITGGEQILLQFLRPAGRHETSLTRQLFVPVGAPLPGVADSYGGIVPPEADAFWDLQIKEWERLLESGRLELGKYERRALEREREEATSLAAAWAKVLPWSTYRSSGVTLRAVDSDAALLRNRERCEKLTAAMAIEDDEEMVREVTAVMRGGATATLPVTPVALSYTVMLRSAALTIRVPCEIDEDWSTMAADATWSWSRVPSAPVFNIWDLELPQEDRPLLEEAIRLQQEIECGMVDTRRSWIPATLQAGAQVTGFDQHVKLLAVALEQAKAKAKEFPPVAD